MVLQRDLDNTTQCLSICMSIATTLGLLKLAQALCFILDHRDDLGTDLNQFGLSQHISASQKVLKAHYEQHKVIAVGRASPSLSDTATLMVPDGVSLSATLAMT